MEGIMIIWIIMIALAVGTFLIRISFIYLFSNREVHPLITRALRFVPASVLSALVIPQILTRNNSLNISLANPQLIAGIVAAVVAWRTKNVLFTIQRDDILWVLQLLSRDMRTQPEITQRSNLNRGITSLMNSSTPSILG
jgi:branched-subunit amino acid transport protein